MSHSVEPFSVKDCALITVATGIKIWTLGEMRDAVAGTDPGSIYHHFWGGLLAPRFEEREYNNDFAAWARHGLHDAPLAERLAVVDPNEYEDIEDLRQVVLDLMEERLDEDEYLHWAKATHRFQFTKSKIVVFDTHRRVATAEELAEAMPHLSTSSVFYHFVDGRRRPPDRKDDFSSWLSGLGEEYEDLIAALAGIDPFFQSLNYLRRQLVTAFSTLLPADRS